MLVALAFFPSPPLLVPEIASGAAVELAGVRLACEVAVQALLDENPDEIVVLGAGLGAGSGAEVIEHDGAAAGSFAGFGVDLVVGGPGPVLLPLALAVGAWLLDRAATTVPRAYLEVPADAGSKQVAELGAALAGRPGRVALAVMGDGSAGRTPKAPAAYDPRAAAYDASIAAALAGGDAEALRALDAAAATELVVAGRSAWQVAASAVLAERAGTGEPYPAVRADLLSEAAPYGVGYLVATWRLGTVPSGDALSR